MTQATTKDYWISSTALHIELNALGYPDYVQASCVSGAQILVYVKDIIGYDAGHNYRRWLLQASPTVFNSHTEKYVYAAIPRTLDSAASAWIVFPSEQIDIYGKNEKEEQIGEDKYYYIFLQGKITSSGDNGTTQRDWEKRCFWGYLSSDEAISAIGTESEWYHYSQADEIVTFLKKITMQPGTWFREFFVKAVTVVTGGSITFEGKTGTISGIANTKTPIDSETDIVTPKYLDKNALSSIHKDVAQDIIRFAKGVVFGSNNSKHTITEEGVATLKSLLIGTDGLGISSAGIAILTGIVSKVFKAGADGNGFRLGNYGNTEDTYLEVDRMLVRKAAEFVQLIIRELRHVGGEIVLTPASMKCTSVEMYSRGDIPWTEGSSEPLDFYRCYFKQEQDGTEIDNQFTRGDLVRCQTFNIKEGTNNNVKNRYYWRRCVYAGKDFIDLSATDADNDSDVPQAGDEMVQLGNDSDKTRQSAILLSSYGDDAPSFKMCQGISAYSLAGKEVFCVSRKELFALADKFQFKTSDGSTQTFAQLLVTMDSFRSEVKKTYATQEEVKQVSSSIEQTAEGIALEVAENTTGLRNRIVGSAFRTWDKLDSINAKYPVSAYNDGKYGSRYARFSASGATASVFAGLYFNDIEVKANTTYEYSVWVRLVTKPDNGAYFRLQYKRTTDTSFSLLKDVVFDVTKSIGEWVLYEGTVVTPAKTTHLRIETCVRKNGVVDICRPMIEEGSTYKGWSLSPNDVTETGALESAAKTSGIDIRRGKITAIADKFEIRNNNGEQTASVNEKGRLEVKSGLFSGFIVKKMTTFTPDNISEYLKSSQSNGYLDIDFSTAGSYVCFTGAMKAKFGDNYPSPVLPYYNIGSISASLGVTAEEAISYIGQIVIIANKSDTTVNVVCGGTIKGGGTQSQWIETGYMAVLTCEFEYTSVKNYKIVWNGYCVKI